MEYIQTWQSAKDYLDENNSEFHSTGPFPNCDNGLFAMDSYSNKIFFVDYPKALPYFESDDHDVDLNEMSEKYKNLIIKIREHAQIFADLELLIRNVPIEETKYNINLIINNLSYLCLEMKEQCLLVGHVTMTEASPLATLGCVGQILMTPFTHFIIDSYKDAAAVCHLFTQLCRAVGLQRVCLLLVEDPTNIACLTDETLIHFNEITGLRRGCVGIITAQANVGAAVDAFVSPSFRFPWNFERILVHTSSYNHFKEAVDEIVTDSNLLIEVKSDSDFFNIEEPALRKHNIGDAGRSLRSIFVNIYENTEDIIAALNKFGVFCISVWTNNESEGNAIAFSVEASFVWINDVNKFEGPPKISQSLYSHIELELSTDKIKKCDVSQQLITLREEWLKNDIKKRLEIVCKAVKSCLNEQEPKDLELLQKLQSRNKWPNKMITETVNGVTCIVKDEPVNLVALQCYVDQEKILENDELLRSVIEGNAILLEKCREIPLLDILKKNGVPIVHVDEYNDDFRVGNAFRLYKTKSFWFNK